MIIWVKRKAIENKSLSLDINNTMMRMKLLSILIVELLMSLQMTAQTTDHVFKLTKENGHFYFETSVNGVTATMLFESGVPGLMMSTDFYEAHKDALGMEVQASNSKIRYLGEMFQIKYTAHARLHIGDAIFEGPVKIVDGATDIKFPIQMLHHAQDNSSIVCMDLVKKELRICSREHLKDLVKDATALDLSFNKWSMPVVNTQLNINADGQRINLKGNFIADMGNGSLLFLNKSQVDVVNMLKDGQVKLKEARDKSGKVVAEGLNANRLTICDRTYKDVSVGVSTFISLGECGFLGLKFFTMPTVFDFDNKKMYLCKD